MTITVRLGNIEAALKQLDNYKQSLEAKVTALVRRLVEDGVNIAKAQVIDLGAFETFELASSIDGMMYVEENKGIIFTDCPYAAYVEFGTGVVGKGEPHPKFPWAYDINNHGDSGWWYPTDETDPNPHKHTYNGQLYAWTKGMPSRPFMYNTSVELRDKLTQIAKEVFQSD